VCAFASSAHFTTINDGAGRRLPVLAVIGINAAGEVLAWPARPVSRSGPLVLRVVPKSLDSQADLTLTPAPNGRFVAALSWP
jgi:hypothetical protein